MIRGNPPVDNCCRQATYHVGARRAPGSSTSAAAFAIPRNGVIWNGSFRRRRTAPRVACALRRRPSTDAVRRSTDEPCRPPWREKELRNDTGTWRIAPDAPGGWLARRRPLLAAGCRAAGRRRRGAPHLEPLARRPASALLLRRRPRSRLERDRREDHRLAAGAGELRRPGAPLRGGERSEALPGVLERLDVDGMVRSRRALRLRGRRRRRLLRLSDPPRGGARSQPLPRVLRSERQPVERLLPPHPERVRAADGHGRQRSAPRLRQGRRRSLLPAILGRPAVERLVRPGRTVRVRAGGHGVSGADPALRTRLRRQPLSGLLRRQPVAGLLQSGIPPRHRDRRLRGGDDLRGEPRGRGGAWRRRRPLREGARRGLRSRLPREHRPDDHGPGRHQPRGRRARRRPGRAQRPARVQFDRLDAHGAVVRPRPGVPQRRRRDAAGLPRDRAAGGPAHHRAGRQRRWRPERPRSHRGRRQRAAELLHAPGGREPIRSQRQCHQLPLAGRGGHLLLDGQRRLRRLPVRREDHRHRRVQPQQRVLGSAGDDSLAHRRRAARRRPHQRRRAPDRRAVLRASRCRATRSSPRSSSTGPSISRSCS